MAITNDLCEDWYGNIVNKPINFHMLKIKCNDSAELWQMKKTRDR
jgi:hypothetical protein